MYTEQNRTNPLFQLQSRPKSFSGTYIYSGFTSLIQYHWDGSLYLSMVHRSFPNDISFFSLKIVIVLASSVDPDEMPRYARGISSGSTLFAKDVFRSPQYTKG